MPKKMMYRSDAFCSALASISSWFGYAFLILPSLIIIPMSFSGKGDLSFPPASFSLFLYKKYFESSEWTDATVMSIRIAVGTMIISTVLGILGAYGLGRSKRRTRTWIGALFLGPMFVPSIVIALSLYFVLAKMGLVGTAAGLILAHSVIALPFAIVTITAGLGLVDRRLETAAFVMGAGKIYVLRRVVVPLILPSIIAAALFSFLISFDEVVISHFVASVRSPTLPVKMYSSIQWEVSPVLAAVSVVLLLVASVLCLVAVTLTKGSKP